MKKLKVHIPKSFESEVIYSFEYLFSLIYKDLSFNFIPTEELSDFVIEFESKKITLSNSFFKPGLSESPCIESNVPKESKSIDLEIGGEHFLIESIFGTNELKIEDEEIFFGTDMIAGTFFMLTRWEESVIQKEDNLGRFDYREALSVKSGFYKRPVIDEYAMILRAALTHLGISIPESNEKSSSQLTFDIDQLEKWQRGKIFLESVYKNLIKLRFGSALEDFISFVSNKISGKPDPYQNLEELTAQLSNSNVSNAVFYFKTQLSESKYDRNRYDLSSTELNKYFQAITHHNYKIGLHPGFDSFDDSKLLSREYNQLKGHVRKEVEHVRQHYLRFKVPNTWLIQEKLGFRYDSSMIYSHSAGFRCGTCHSFPVFDFSSGKLLDIVELPLLFMETPYMNSPEELIKDFDEVKRHVDKHGGNMVVLWHNGNLEYKWQRRLFKKLLERIA